MNDDPIRKLIALHARVMESGFNYAYFELARTRTTEWMAWICTDARELDPHRIILAKGQGRSPDEACGVALESYPLTIHKAWLDEKLTNQQAESLVDLRRFAPQKNDPVSEQSQSHCVMCDGWGCIDTNGKTLDCLECNGTPTRS